MTEYLIEHLVKRNPTMGTYLKKAALISLPVLGLLLMPLLGMFGPLVVVILIMVDMFFFKRLDLEYEYVFYNGDLEIDKVMGREARKHLLSVNIKEIDVLAPTGAQEVLGYQHLKAIDYSTCTQGNQTYEMVIPKGAEKVRIIFEPNEAMLKAMKDLAPRKVVF